MADTVAVTDVPFDTEDKFPQKKVLDKDDKLDLKQSVHNTRLREVLLSDS